MKVPKIEPSNKPMRDVAAILVAGGASARFGASSSAMLRKQFELIGDLPMYQYVALTFSRAATIHTIVLVGPASDVAEMEAGLTRLNLPVNWKVVPGGATRQESVANGLCAITGNEITIAIVHDVARALVEEDLIRSVIEAIRDHGAAAACLEVVDTIKRVEHSEIVETIPRENLWRAQTPQGARVELLRAAHDAAREAHLHATDESQLLERIGIYPRIVRGSEMNFKITYPSDLERARGVDGNSK
jgi:2-C-methyl-D-erythritol 4-phosphate cytidylyltransferase